jgi:hypothetical protein
MKITVPIITQFGFHAEAEAEIVDVAPHLNGTFAVHKGVTIGLRDLWLVTHVETGHQAAAAKPTKALAVSWARKYLAGKSPQAFAAAVRRALKETPLADEVPSERSGSE